MEYSIVIPVYSGSDTLDELCRRIIAVFDNVLHSSFEVILVDDASPDDSWAVMQKLHAGNRRIKIIRLTRNFGQQRALLCGFAHAAGEYVLTMDDDLQHPPEEIPKLISAMASIPETDVAIAAFENKQHSWLRNCGTRVLNFCYSRISGKDPGLQLTSFRLIRRHVVDQLLQVEMEMPLISLVLLHLTNRVINTPVRHDPRKYGNSGYSFGRLVKDFLGFIVNNSAFPLRVTSWIGIASSMVSLVLGVVYLYRYWVGAITVPGWTTLVLLMVFYFGVLLLAVGVIGDYLIRILKATRRLPLYVVRDKNL